MVNYIRMRNSMVYPCMKKEQDKAWGCKLPLAVTADGRADRNSTED